MLQNKCSKHGPFWFTFCLFFCLAPTALVIECMKTFCVYGAPENLTFKVKNRPVRVNKFAFKISFIQNVVTTHSVCLSFW